jgi:pseudouridine synthase
MAKQPQNRARPGGPGAGDREADGRVRLQRFLADAGVASRRASELLIEEGRVKVNGKKVVDLPAFVTPGVDRVQVDGQPIEGAERHVYVMLNKPGRTLSTVEDEPGAARRTVLDLVEHPSGARLYPVGRLDFDTRGLVLLTNDGELANRLTHPRFGVEKTYHAVVRGYLEEEALERLEKGIYLAERREGRTVGATRAAHVRLKIVKRDRDRTVLELTLKEGRNRQVRRMLAAVGSPVKKLERVAMGPLQLKGLAVGEWRELTKVELQALRRAVDKAGKVARAAASGSGKPAATPTTTRGGGARSGAAPSKPTAPGPRRGSAPGGGVRGKPARAEKRR